MSTRNYFILWRRWKHSISTKHIATRSILKDGNAMPQFGFGCYKLADNMTKSSVSTALKHGYRLIDTAQQYGNEKFVGQALRESKLQREDFFVVTKLSYFNGYAEAMKSCMESLKLLQIDYIDLYLIHSPSTGKVIETWEAFTTLQKQGYIRSIGVSNFHKHHLKPLLDNDLPAPVVNQIEYHPWNQQKDLLKYCRQHDMNIMGYCPLARMQLFTTEHWNPRIDVICQKYEKTRTQVILRWSLQNGVITIPKSSSEARIIENGSIFDFELDTAEMEFISDLDKGIQIASVSAKTDPWLG